MEPNIGTAGAAHFTAAEAGRVLLAAMNAEEPFRLLSAIQGKLQELCAIGRRRESTTGQLVEDMVLAQSQNCDSISSGVSRIRECRNEMESLLDLHVQHLQRESDNIQELLEELHDNRRLDALPRRSRAQEKLSSDLSNEISKLQDTNKQILEVSCYVCGVAEGLVADKRILGGFIHRIAREMGLVQGECDPREQDTHPELDEGTIPNGIRDIERRCEDVEAAVIHNNEVISRQVQEIVRGSATK